MLFTDICQDFLLSCKHERGLSVASTDTYSAWLSHFNRWSDESEIGASFDERFVAPVLKRYLYHLSKRNLRPRTIRGCMAPLRSLGDYCVRSGLLSENPAHFIPLPKKDAPQRLQVSTEELTALLAATELQSDPKKIALERGMLSVLILTGIRYSEMMNLKVGDISLDNGTLLVQQGKGKKSRLLRPPTDCMAAIAEWLSFRDKRCSHDWLWAHDTARRVGEWGFRQMLEEVKARAGFKGNDAIKPHSMRHAFATRMMMNGASIKVIQACLGHSNAFQTYQYLWLQEEETKLMPQFASLSGKADVEPPKPASPPPAELPQPVEPPMRKREFQQMRRVGATRPR